MELQKLRRGFEPVGELKWSAVEVEQKSFLHWFDSPPVERV